MIKDEPAFPGYGSADVKAQCEAHGMSYSPPQGMTLRDYFAAKALSGSLADPEVNGSFENIAKFAYKMADAMLKERTK